MEELETVVQNDAEIKSEPSRWYEGHISLEDAKTFIKSNITTAARSFIAIGFYLKCVRDRNLFEEDNYQDVWDFAKSEYGISKSTASRYMSMNERFSENGNSPNIKTEYKSFGKSQLQEMLYLEDEQLEQVKPGDRVEDIRNLRRPKEIPYIELPGQMDFEIDFPDILPPDQIEQPVMLQKQTFEINVVDLLSGEEQESVAISQQDAEVNSQDFEDKRREEWLIRCDVLRKMCNALCDMHSYGLEKDNYSMTAIQRISSGSYGFGFGDDGSDHSEYNVEYKEPRYCVEKFDGIGNWVFESGEIDQQIWNFNGREWHNAHPDQQKLETSQLEDKGFYNPDDEKKVDGSNPENVIEQPGSVPEEDETVPVSSENVIDGEYEEVPSEPIKQEQPDLPILKNNDQRAAFIDAYETWPIWIETKQTGERYYRYDLSEKAAIVVKVYWKHSWESYKESKDYEYGAAQYYLLGVKSEWHNGKSAYVEDESRTFYECGTNRSALVEYLKEFQKKQ